MVSHPSSSRTIKTLQIFEGSIKKLFYVKGANFLEAKHQSHQCRVQNRLRIDDYVSRQCKVYEKTLVQNASLLHLYGGHESGFGNLALLSCDLHVSTQRFWK